MAEKKILVVDDEEPIRKLFEMALTQKGYTVLCAETSEEALEIIQTETIPVYFLDLNLPGMDGIELCKRILKLQPDAITFAVTGYVNKYKFDECMAAGFEDYFTKPVLLQTLFDAADKAFDKITPKGS